HQDFVSLRAEKLARVRGSKSTGGGAFDIANFESLAAWEEFWGLMDGAVVQGTLLYQGGEFRRRIQGGVGEIAPQDLRLLPGSAGYRAGKDGKDLGPDVDLVGPGAAYERWKQTPEYRQWLKDTGQLKK